MQRREVVTVIIKPNLRSAVDDNFAISGIKSDVIKNSTKSKDDAKNIKNNILYELSTLFISLLFEIN